MLTGGKPFDADGSYAVMHAQLEMVPCPPSMMNPEVPVAFDEIVARSLAKNPAERFQSAEDFRKALEAAAAGLTHMTGVKEMIGANQALRRSRLAMVPALVPAVLVAVMGLAIWPYTKHLVRGGSPKPNNLPRSVPTATSPAPPASASTMSGKPATGTSEPSVARTNEQTSPARGTKATPSLRPNESLPEDTSEETVPPKTGNRFIRVLGKLNPFHRGAKNITAER